MRVRHDTETTTGERRVLSWIAGFDPPSQLVEKLTEVFILRDAVTHNHLWEVAGGTDRGRYAEVIAKRLVEISGDAKYGKIVDKETGLTPVLHLHVIPTRVDRTDVKKVLSVVWETMQFLRKEDDDFDCSVAMLNIAFSGALVVLKEFKQQFDSAI